MQISAQLVSLPRSITNCCNLSRPLTLSFAGRQLIVPPSCVVLSAEGAKLLLPPQTIVPNKHLLLTEPVNLSTPSKSGFASETEQLDKVCVVSNEFGQQLTPAEQSTTLERNESQSRLDSGLGLQFGLGSAEPQCDVQTSVGGNGQLFDFQVLVRVFTFLPVYDLLQSRRVCTRWNSAALNQTLVSHHLDSLDTNSVVEC